MSALDRFVARNTFIEVDPATWLAKPTASLQLGHVATIEKQDVATHRKHRFTYPVAMYGETASDPALGIECLPHNSPLATAVPGLAVALQRGILHVERRGGARQSQASGSEGLQGGACYGPDRDPSSQPKTSLGL